MIFKSLFVIYDKLQTLQETHQEMR